MDNMTDPAVRSTARTGPEIPIPARVLRRYGETAGVWTMELEAPTGFATCQPGQFNMLYAMGVGEVPISVSGADASGALMHTIRDVGAVTGALARLEAGEMLGLRGPFGTAWPLDEARGKDVVIIAGGIGLAPIRPVLYRLLADPDSYGRVTLLYGARSSEEILYSEQLARWGETTAAHVEITVDHKIGDWAGPVGVVTTLLRPGLFDPARTLAMVCGPEVMMRFAVNALLDHGLSEAGVYLSMERNMKCAVGHCGHCQFGPTFICKDGPVFRYDRLRRLLSVREL
ncbi:MAG: FAD/NAD(P)-binding protein [Alphaproteobacteria bacterium]